MSKAMPDILVQAAALLRDGLVETFNEHKGDFVLPASGGAYPLTGVPDGQFAVFCNDGNPDDGWDFDGFAEDAEDLISVLDKLAASGKSVTVARMLSPQDVEYMTGLKFKRLK